MQISCPSMWKLRIQPIIDAGTMTATMELPEGQEVKFDGKVVYSSAVDDEYLVGNRFSIADIATATGFVNFHHGSERVDPARWPKLAAYVDRGFRAVADG